MQFQGGIQMASAKTANEKYTGVYVFGTPETAFISILLPDNTCGMFLMPSAQDVFWAGAGEYRLNGDKLQFKVQNTGTVQEPKPVKGEQYYDVTFTPGAEYVQQYVQHGEKRDCNFVLITKDTKFWEKLKGWQKLGEPRRFQGREDFDFAHEIKKICAMVLDKWGPVFVWA